MIVNSDRLQYTITMGNKATKEAAAALGRRGGKAVAKKHGKGYMKSLGKKGATARWKDKE